MKTSTCPERRSAAAGTAEATGNLVLPLGVICPRCQAPPGWPCETRKD